VEIPPPSLKGPQGSQPTSATALIFGPVEPQEPMTEPKSRTDIADRYVFRGDRGTVFVPNVESQVKARAGGSGAR
jgi:hypothetical protein